MDAGSSIEIGLSSRVECCRPDFLRKSLPLRRGPRRDGILVGFWVHEVIAVAIDIAELKFHVVGVENSDGVSRADFSVGASACVEVAHCNLHKSGLTALGTVLHVQHEVWIALIVENFALTDVCR